MTITLERPNVNWLTFMFWLLANVLSFGLVGAMFHNFPLAFTFPPNLTRLGTFGLASALLGGVLFGFVPALLIGFLQRWILRRHLPLSRWWIISVSAGIGLLHFFSDGFENARDLSLAVLLSGLMVGVIQWRLLRPHLASATWWVLASGLGWYVGGLMGSAIWVNGLEAHGRSGLTTGLMYGLSTGLLLGWLLRNQKAT
jgi:hypothetical protein